jgi:hypothetical protein
VFQTGDLAVRADLLAGIVEVVGLEDGIDEIVGWVDGLDDGASLCGNASKTMKSDANAEVTFATAWTESTVMVDVTFIGIWPEPSKLITAIPRTSYIPGMMTEFATVISAI